MADGATFLNYWPIVSVLAEKKRARGFPFPGGQIFIITVKTEGRKSSTSVDCNQPSRLSSFILSYIQAVFNH